MSPSTADCTALEELLREWLPKQRWFAGKDRGAKAVHITSHRVLLAGDPSLVHLFAEVEQPPQLDQLDRPADDRLTTTYQLVLGVRAELPRDLEHASIGHVDELGHVYDASQDRDLMHVVLGWIAGAETQHGIVFAHEPGAVIDRDAVSLVLGGEQSNTSI